MFAETLFWISYALIAYTYVIYVFLLLVVVKLTRQRRTSLEQHMMPSVSVVVSAYNEARTLGARIENLKRSHYPDERVDILVGSDGSTDATNSILESIQSPRLRIFLFNERRGKAAVLNDLVKAAQGEIVVFTDANTSFDTNTIGTLVAPFENPLVGSVCGNLVLDVDAESVGGASESMYWRYENMIKRLESDYKSVFGATGGVYAIRKSLFRPLPTSIPVTDDLVIPLRILESGFCTKYEPRALAYEASEQSILGEFRRKARISAQNYNSIKEFKGLLAPTRGFVAIGLWSHKIIRWMVPFLLIAAFISSAFLARASVPYSIVLVAELVFIALALFGLILELLKVRTGVFGVPYYFLATNMALLVGFIRFLFNVERPMWEVHRS